MKRLISCSAVLLAAMLLAQAVHADVKTKERVTFQLGGALGKIVNFFAGSAAKDGVVSTVAVKSNRKSAMTESTGQIIDLGEQKVYDLDLKKKEYKVTTFDEMRKRLQEDRDRAEKQAKERAQRKIRSRKIRQGDRVRSQREGNRTTQADCRLRHARGGPDDHGP